MSYKRGQFVWTRYGSTGSQLAQIDRVTSRGRVLAFKWSRNARRWTRTAVDITFCILRPASPEDGQRVGAARRIS